MVTPVLYSLFVIKYQRFGIIRQGQVDLQYHVLAEGLWIHTGIGVFYLKHKGAKLQVSDLSKRSTEASELHGTEVIDLCLIVR